MALSLSPRVRKLLLTGHVTSSVGWLGAALAYLALAVTGLTTHDVQLARAVYPALELIGWLVIVPLSLAALASGVVQSLGTSWGLLRHYWIVAKLFLTLVGTLVLLLHMPAVSLAANAATATSRVDFGGHALPLVIHAAGGVLLLLAATALSVFKPWGKTPLAARGSSTP